MPGERLLISACRDVVAYGGHREPGDLFDTETGKQRYEVAQTQHDLEQRFFATRKALFALFRLLQSGGSRNEMYIKEFGDREQDLASIYGKLQALNYEKSFGAACCPVIEYTETREQNDENQQEADKEKEA